MRWNGFNPHEQSQNSVPDGKNKVLCIIYHIELCFSYRLLGNEDCQFYRILRTVP
jgi:hypothetical protein